MLAIVAFNLCLCRTSIYKAVLHDSRPEAAVAIISNLDVKIIKYYTSRQISNLLYILFDIVLEKSERSYVHLESIFIFEVDEQNCLLTYSRCPLSVRVVRRPRVTKYANFVQPYKTGNGVRGPVAYGRTYGQYKSLSCQAF